MRLKLLITSVIVCLLGAVSTPLAKQETPKEQVVLVHGFARNGNAMWLIENRLKKLGYETCSVDYGSTEAPVSDLIAELKEQIDQCRLKSGSQKKLNFVTHSMGGPLVRAYLQKYPEDNLGRVVMLSPPNQGTPFADMALHVDKALTTKIGGPAASGLHTGAGSWLSNLPKPSYEVGIIGGNFTFNPVAAYLLPGEDDGLVPVSNMKMAGMKDFTTVKATHVTIRYSKAAFDHIVSFLRNGTFHK